MTLYAVQDEDSSFIRNLGAVSFKDGVSYI